MILHQLHEKLLVSPLYSVSGRFTNKSTDGVLSL